MKSKWSFLLIGLLAGCTLFKYDDFRYYPNGLNVSVLVDYEFISNTSTEVVYDVKLASFDYSNNLYFDSSSYTFDGSGTFNILEIEGMATNSNAVSSNIILIDQSGSYLEIDPHNFRTKAINKFFENLSPQENHILGGFSSQGLLTNEPVEFANNDFSSEWTDQNFLFDLVKKTGGNSSLYDAINLSIDKLAPRNDAVKNIIVLLHTNDESSAHSISNLIENSVTNNITTYFILLGPQPTPTKLWDLNHKTRGMLAICPQDLHIVTLFNHLEELISGTAYTSRLRIRFKPDGGNIISGSSYENQIKIIDPLSGYEFNPVYVKIDIP